MKRKSKISNERIEHLINFIEEDHDKLNSWETGFFESIQHWWEDYGFLSDEQVDKLEEVYKQLTGR